MITQENLKMVLANVSNKALNDILDTDKEYILIDLHVANAGYAVTASCTNDIENEYELNDGTNTLLYTDEVIAIYEDLYLDYVNNWITVSRFNEFYNCDDNFIETLRAYFNN